MWGRIAFYLLPDVIRATLNSLPDLTVLRHASYVLRHVAGALRHDASVQCMSSGVWQKPNEIDAPASNELVTRKCGKYAHQCGKDA